MKRISVILGVSVFLAIIAPFSLGQDKLQASEFQVTFDSGGHSTPMVGKDSIGDLIVYSQYPIVNGVPGNAGIYYQRVANGAPFGPAVTVADSPENQWLNDVSGDNIVYTLSPSIGAYGNIVLYQISTAQARALTTTSNAWLPRIFGDYVVWAEMTPTGAGQVVLYQISSGTPVQTTVVAGPSPSASDPVIGDRFIVWSEVVNGRYRLSAYDMAKGLGTVVATDPQADLHAPSTSGSWIAYEAWKPTGQIDIRLINMDTNETRVIASGGSLNLRPHISGDLISYESNVLGNSQVFIYRIAQGDTFQVTSSTYDEHLNDILGNLVTYIDSRNGNDGVFASSITFVAGQPITVTPNPLNFGSVNLGSSSTQNLTLTINHSVSTLPSIAAGGAYSVPTVYSCVFSIPTTCTVPVTFTPTQPGHSSVALLVTDTNNNRYSFSLQGTGTGAAVAFTPGAIGTVAGGGPACTDSTTACGDGGPATGAGLSSPAGVKLDGAGNIYFADTGSNRIRVMNQQNRPITVAGVTIAAGDIATVAGNGQPSNGTQNPGGDGVPATTVQLYYPSDVAVDAVGNIYIADNDNFLVRKVDVNGIATIFAGGGGLCANATDNFGDGCPATGGVYLGGVTGVAVDSSGVYIADWGDGMIRKVGSDGVITRFAGTGTPGFAGDGGPAASAELQYPSGMAFDAAGSLYIADTFNHRVRKVSGGNISTVAGSGSVGVGAGGYYGDGGQATNALLKEPRAVALDSAGNLYIADAGNYRIRKVDPSGIITTVAGFGALGNACSFGTYILGDNCPATSAFLGYPEGVAVDGAGDIYIADNEDNRIRTVIARVGQLDFGTLNTGATSNVQTLSVSNVGNATLNFAQTDAFRIAMDPASTSIAFQLQSVSDACATGSSLAAGASCALGVVFAPTITGPASDGLLVFDDVLPSNGQVAMLRGTALGTPPAFGLPGSTLAIAEATGPNGAVVSFINPSATTWNGSAASVSCNPASGSQFALGQTTISCTASDPTAPSLQTTSTFYVVVRDTTPPVLTLPANIVTDAIAPNGAPVSYTVTGTDLVDRHPLVNCSQVSGTIFAIGTTTVTCAATDFSGNTRSGSFTVLVKAAAQQVTDLVALTNTYNLKQGIQNSLDTKLQNAEAALTAANAGVPASVCNLMAAFINETTAQSGKALTVDQASQLIANATRIKTVLACQ